MEITPIGGTANTQSFTLKMAQDMMQSNIETSDTQSEEFSMPASKIAGLEEVVGAGKFIRPQDKALAFNLVLSS